MIEKCRKNVDKGGISIALRIDLSKAFNCIVHYFFTAKLEAQSFFVKSLKLYTIGDPAGAVLFPPLFNICIFFLFTARKNDTSYTDDTTPYSNADSVVNFIEDIEAKEKI